jgi:hypothetical protein
MHQKKLMAAALAAALSGPIAAHAADDKELAAIRAQIQEMKQAYEARLQALEQRLQAAQAAQAASPAPPPETAAPVASAPSSSNAFNPDISLVLGGTFTRTSQDPANYRIQGFLPSGGEVGPGKRSFNLGESELTLAANIDPMFSGQLTFSLAPENTVSVEESFVQTRALSNGLNLRVGRFLSSIGYLNSQHAHAWDFVDAPLAYQAFFGGQYKPDGVQAKWLAPTDMFLELGAEAGSGAAFPGSERSKNGFGAGTVFVHAGDDIGDSGSWRAGLSYLRTGSENRDSGEVPSVSFSGRSTMWVADAIYKWAPNGNPTHQNFKLQGEYLHRKEAGSLDVAGFGSSELDTTQSGWYLQGVYQFEPGWRGGVRYDRLDSGTVRSPVFAVMPFTPKRSSVMFDYSPSEFSRLRLQLAHDQSSQGAADNQIFLQYIMSLGTHAAHAF